MEGEPNHTCVSAVADAIIGYLRFQSVVLRKATKDALNMLRSQKSIVPFRDFTTTIIGFSPLLNLVCGVWDSKGSDECVAMAGKF